MLSLLFRWIYCLNISVLILLITVLTLAFAAVYTKHLHRRSCRPLLSILLVVLVSVILISTLFTRSGRAEALTPILALFESYKTVLNGGNPELLRSCFMNMVLFYPVGLLAFVLLPQKWAPYLKILLIGLTFGLLSAGIECAQYVYALGQAEVDDVLHNTLGAVIGSGVGVRIMFRTKNVGTK